MNCFVFKMIAIAMRFNLFYEWFRMFGSVSIIYKKSLK